MGFRGSDDQRNLTPLQRQILDAERSRRARAKQERMEEMQSGTGGHGQQTPQGGQRPTNSRAGGNTRTQEETVRYINRSENPDYEFPE